MRTRLTIGMLGAVGSVAVLLSLTVPTSAQQPAPQTKGPISDTNLNSGRINATGGPQGKGKGKQKGPSAPTPHWPDGRVNLGPPPGQKGMWEGNAGATLATNPPGGLDNPTMYLPTNIKIEDVPWQPWAKAVY